MYRQQYVASVLSLMRSYFQARGFSDYWLFGIAERAVSTLWQWELARAAVELFKQVHEEYELDGWEGDAVEFVEYLLCEYVEGVVWRNELAGELIEEPEPEFVELQEELPL
jgi:hypothetical protein